MDRNHDSLNRASRTDSVDDQAPVSPDFDSPADRTALSLALTRRGRDTADATATSVWNSGPRF
ncbi:hypothetical protein [Pseudofrankia sp. BMG5.37]|uniref:hypothetical protein n=1 Tax=Pseudofrankia sp. BMG5.37 TaxID=3050035 RepID=UPI0028938E6A|nr:hypothetical protein [Pseudofrankia sp. BMG5.37]MDT3445395.1 hypothetical protein [Pseudofrankia sp. BMG5.37]